MAHVLIVEADLLGFGERDEVAFGGFPGAVYKEPVVGSGCGVEDVVTPPVRLHVVVVLAHGGGVVGAGVAAFAVFDAVLKLCVLGGHGAVGAAQVPSRASINARMASMGTEASGGGWGCLVERWS